MTVHLPFLSESVFVEIGICASRLSSAGACNLSVSTRSADAATEIEFHRKVRYRVLVQNGVNDVTI